MPISADTFDATEGHPKPPSTRRRILEFLQAHRDEAFTQRELEANVRGNSDMQPIDAKIVGILLSLEGARQIVSKQILEKGEFVKYYKAALRRE